MNEIVDYVVAFGPLRSPDVIGGSKLIALQDLVKQEMKKGWQPLGAVNLFTHGDAIHAGQALVKYKEEPETVWEKVEQPKETFPEVQNSNGGSIQEVQAPAPKPGRPRKVEA